ncbi:hypothetical protein DSO57_1018362 [Entomophthora muscae]|uniref:Uncharacterized protein n=1 Tax=Entomophthora muscae TaxID=34485 RepID=A0ACC2SH56_9FUNG|nr:hypothetical protein DSO57_1018362 [Entomophthora muscae]
MGPAMVSQANSPGLGPIRSLDNAGQIGHSLLADPANLGEPIRSVSSNRFNTKSTLYNVESGNQPIKLWARQDAREQHTLYDPYNLGQPISSSSATCNSMHRAPNESSNLNEPITPDDTIKVDSPNASYNNCNLNEPIMSRPARNDKTHHAPDNCYNLNKPIRPCDAMETNTPNVLYNNCNPDGPIRSSTAGANYTHTAKTGCPKPQANQFSYKRDPNWPNQFSSSAFEPMDTFHTPPGWFNSFWVAINQPSKDGKPQVTSDAKRAPFKPDGPRERPGLSAVKTLRQLMMSISLKDLCTESPKFRQKMHQAISALHPGKYEALFLTGTGALRTTGAVNSVYTSIILDGSA